MAKKQSGKKQDARAAEIQRGKTLLAAWGVHEGALPPGTPDDQVLSTLEPFIGKDPACDLLIAEMLGKLSIQASADRLSRWEESAQGKSLKREIRRSLFKLEQKGFKVARKAPETAPVSLAVPASEPEGYLGPIDGEGSRMAWLIKAGRGGVTGLLSVINDVEGMIFVDAVVARRPALMKTVNESSSAGPVVPVPWQIADGLMHQAFTTAPPKPGNMRSDYLLTRAEMIKEPPAKAPDEPDLSAIPAPEAGEESLLEQSAELFREREFRTWLLPPEIARPHLQKLMSSSNSGLVLSKEAATERTVGIMDEALEEFLAGPLRDRFVTRLRRMAWHFHLQDRAYPAQLAVALASAMENPGERKLKDLSFMRALVFRAFAPYLAREEGPDSGSAPETAEGSSRILDPSKVSIREAAPDQSEPDDPSSVIIRP